jgi:hypothetical protein
MITVASVTRPVGSQVGLAPQFEPGRRHNWLSREQAESVKKDVAADVNVRKEHGQRELQGRIGTLPIMGTCTASALGIRSGHGVVPWSSVLFKQPVAASQVPGRPHAPLGPLEGKPNGDSKLKLLRQARRKPMLPVAAVQPGLQNPAYPRSRLGDAMLHITGIGHGPGQLAAGDGGFLRVFRVQPRQDSGELVDRDTRHAVGSEIAKDALD